MMPDPSALRGTAEAIRAGADLNVPAFLDGLAETLETVTWTAAPQLRVADLEALGRVAATIILPLIPPGVVVRHEPTGVALVAALNRAGYAIVRKQEQGL